MQTPVSEKSPLTGTNLKRPGWRLNTQKWTPDVQRCAGQTLFSLVKPDSTFPPPPCCEQAAARRWWKTPFKWAETWSQPCLQVGGRLPLLAGLRERHVQTDKRDNLSRIYKLNSSILSALGSTLIIYHQKYDVSIFTILQKHSHPMCFLCYGRSDRILHLNITHASWSTSYFHWEHCGAEGLF